MGGGWFVSRMDILRHTGSPPGSGTMVYAYHHRSDTLLFSPIWNLFVDLLLSGTLFRYLVVALVMARRRVASSPPLARYMTR